MKVYLQTFGCRANQYDSEVVRGLLEQGGAEIVADVADADAAVFNSCAVTAAAEADVRRAVRRAARQRPTINTVVMGCAAARDPDGIGALPGVSRVIPAAGGAEVAAALGIPAGDARPARQTGSRALLRIQDGCDEHCTFCATTLARGANRSRTVDALVAEAAQLGEHHGEIVLTGVHIGSYGLDAGTSLGALVERLVHAAPRARFRLSSVEATEVDDRLRERLASNDGGLVPYLHAPLQSGADSVLRRMGRHWYTAASYARAIERIVRDAPVFGLGADIIAGFPGESEDDHRATTSLVSSLPFTGLHVFPFSPRPGTAAQRIGAAVSSADATRRAEELRAQGERLAAAYRERRAGGYADVIVIGDRAHRNGLTEDYLSVIPADDALSRGTRTRMRLTLENGVLFGRAC
ncbi:MAG TPA: MiaB/RimO family radical SAM methylthiotransferase [Gemmatimonadaceae bacterium]|nr:MiaB/RimO family radical SAM methylthiotransferase [Gemmatimonadaceae bacterium]